jgi:general L-amino acid transport system permease protein
MSDAQARQQPSVSLLYNPRVRGFLYQAVLIAIVGFLGYEAVVNASTNMRARGIPTDFSFWDRVASFDINQTLISYSASSTYGRAFFVGLWNTLLVAGIGVVLATFLGFFVGIARLSQNLVVSKLATLYVEVMRNTPLLLQLLFIYNAVLKPLPNPRESISLGAGVYINNRGLVAPDPQFAEGAIWIPIAALVGVVLAIAFRYYAQREQARTGRIFPVVWIGAGLVLGLPLLAYFAAGQPVSFVTPVLRGFNFQGGVRILPEFVALLIGLVIYTAAFIAEIVRAGIQSVDTGQWEAAEALGLRRGLVMRRIVLPQALRVIVPPMTSQYLNLAKNSSLAVAIGYQDIVSIANTTLNQTGQAIEGIAIIMLVYLTISLSISLFMNWYNARIALVER